MSIYQTLNSPVGELLLVGEPTQGGVALTSVSMTGQRYAPVPRDDWRLAPEAFADVTRQLEAYFAGELPGELAGAAADCAEQRPLWSCRPAPTR